MGERHSRGVEFSIDEIKEHQRIAEQYINERIIQEIRSRLR